MVEETRMLGLENVSVFGHIKQWREGDWIQSVRPSTDRTEASVQKEDLPWGGGGRQLVFGVRNHLTSIRTVPELGTLLSLAGERPPPPMRCCGAHPCQKEKRMQMLESSLKCLTHRPFGKPQRGHCAGLGWTGLLPGPSTPGVLQNPNFLRRTVSVPAVRNHLFPSVQILPSPKQTCFL